MPRFERRETETFNYISKDASRKLESCFHKLYKIIARNKLTLWKVFNDFDKKKGSLTLPDFALLIKKLSGSSLEIQDEEIRLGFELIDEDSSNSIEFEELNKYYSKINGVPLSANLPYEPMQVEPQGPNQGQFSYGQPHQQPHQGQFSQGQFSQGQFNQGQFSQGQEVNPFHAIGQAYQQQGGFNQFAQNNNYQPNSQGGQGSYGQAPNNSFGGSQMGNGGNQSYPPNQSYPGYPQNTYNNQGFSSSGQQTPPPPGSFNPLDFLRKG